MTDPNSKGMASAFLDRLQEQQALSGSAQDDALRQAQIFCGRWLALRRLRQGLTLEQLATRSNIDPECLLFLETGLADETLAMDNSWRSLSCLLSTNTVDQALVWAVLSIALGRVDALDDRVMVRVRDQIEQVMHSN